MTQKLEEAKKLYQTANEDQRYILESLFPELKESEDEKIRKGIIKYLSWIKDKDGSYMPNNIHFDEMIAWLEKQGKMKPNPVLDIEIPFGAKDSELQEATHHIPKGFHAEIDDDKVVIKQGEQKPAWSEKDENMLKMVIKSCEQFGNEYAYYWLKSLKDRYTWKPSDEQMEALHDLNLTGNISYAGQGQVLIELYNDLKKLKG